MDMTEFIPLYLMFIVILAAAYFYVAYVFIIKTNRRNNSMKGLYTAILNVYEDNLSIPISYERIKLNYEKICQVTHSIMTTSLLDNLEMLIFYYDAYTGRKFETKFKQTKNFKIRDFIIEIWKHINQSNPFISAPEKESRLLQEIKNAVLCNEKNSVDSLLVQLSVEIRNKENLLRKKEKDNQRAYIVSILGIVFTIFFGILSIRSIFW